MNDAGSSIDHDGTGSSEDIDLRQFLSFALNRIWLAAICVFVFLLAGIFYLRITPPIYTATAIVEIPLEAQKVVDMQDSESQDFRGEEILKTLEKNLQRISLFQRVMARAEVKESNALRISLEDPMDSYSPGDLAGLLKEWATVKLQGGSRLITVSVEHQSPDVAEMLANAIVGEFIRERVEMDSGSSTSAFEFLLIEAEKAREGLEESEDRLLNFQEYKDALVLKEKIDAHEDIVHELSQRYRDKHPKLVQARSSLADLNDQLQSQLMPARPPAGSSTGLQEKGAPADGDPGAEARLDDELNLLEGRFNVLSREVEADRVLYESIVSHLKQTDVTKQWEAPPLQIVEPAFAPSMPSKPKKIQVLGASLILGGAVGLSLIFILYSIDGSIRTVEDAMRILGLPVIGAVPRNRRLRKAAHLENAANRPMDALKQNLRKRKTEGIPGSQPVKPAHRNIEPLVILSDPLGAAAEALRTVRAELGARGSAEEPRSFLVTSALTGEGKSFVASNLAVSFAAEEGSKTLLIDANLRRPIVHTLLDAASTGGGLVEALAGEPEWKSLIVDSGIPQLDLLLAGVALASPAEFLSGNAFPRLLKDLARNYARIVVDTPGVHAAADTLLLAPHVDFAVLVIRAAKTPRDDVIRARDLLADMGCRPAGLVLNCSAS